MWLWKQLEDTQAASGRDPVGDAHIVVATSVGAVVAALWAAGKGPLAQPHRILFDAFAGRDAGPRLVLDAGVRGIAGFGLIASAALAEELAEHLGEWPANLAVCVWDLRRWKRKVLRADDGVDLATAVAAACSVPPFVAAARVTLVEETTLLADAALGSNTNSDVALAAGGSGYVHVYDPLGSLPRRPAPWETAIRLRHRRATRREHSALEAAGWTVEQTRPTPEEAAAIWRRPWEGSLTA